MLCTQLGQGFQFPLGPDPTAGIVGVAEKQQFGSSVNLFLQVLQVHHVATRLEFEGIGHHMTAVSGNRLVKGPVHRGLDNDLVSGVGKGHNG